MKCKIKLSVSFILFITVICSLSSCQKSSVQTPSGSIIFQINYQSGNAALSFDTIQYQNISKSSYSVTHLEYFLSDVTLLGADGTKILRKDVYYINARIPSTNLIEIKNVALKEYNGIEFNIGLNADTNKSGALPAIQHHLNMFWPDPMGGGYHFLKLEGHFLDTTNKLLGYALHLGTNTCLVNASINQPFSLTNKVTDLTMIMDVAEWFDNPHAYDLNTKSYIMGSQIEMRKIADNGANAFSIP